MTKPIKPDCPGIPVYDWWSSSISYKRCDRVARVTHDQGATPFVCIQDNKGQDPALDTDQIYWYDLWQK